MYSGADTQNGRLTWLLFLQPRLVKDATIFKDILGILKPWAYSPGGFQGLLTDSTALCSSLLMSPAPRLEPIDPPEPRLNSLLDLPPLSGWRIGSKPGSANVDASA